MFNLKQVIAKITAAAVLILVAVCCSKDQNSFLPYVRVNFSMTPYEYNFLTISGNSIVFENQGLHGIIVVCVDPGSSQYYAYDATCPYEIDYTGIIVVKAVKNYTSPPLTIFSSDFYGICNKCGSTFNLMAAGLRVRIQNVKCKKQNAKMLNFAF